MTERRGKTENEIRAGTDFDHLASSVEATAQALHSLYLIEVADHIQTIGQELTGMATVASGSRLKVRASEDWTTQTNALLMALAANAALAAQSELAGQDLEGDTPGPERLAPVLSGRVTTLGSLLAGQLVTSAQGRLLRVSQREVTAEVVDEVVRWLASLKFSAAMDQFVGAAMGAIALGRQRVFETARQRKVLAAAGDFTPRFIASELLDQNTCAPCGAVDGVEFPDLAMATAAYPSGGYIDCLGGPRCRGALILVAPEDAA